MTALRPPREAKKRRRKTVVAEPAGEPEAPEAQEQPEEAEEETSD